MLNADGLMMIAIDEVRRSHTDFDEDAAPRKGSLQARLLKHAGQLLRIVGRNMQPRSIEIIRGHFLSHPNVE